MDAGEDHCGAEYDQHRERNEAMTGDAVISSAADERTEQVTQRAKTKIRPICSSGLEVCLASVGKLVPSAALASPIMMKDR